MPILLVRDLREGPPKKIGEHCAEDDQACDSLLCRGGVCSSCDPDLAEDPCSSGICIQDPSQNNAYECIAKELYEPCTEHSECTTEFCDPDRQECWYQRPWGSCTEHHQCVPSWHCDPNSNICVLPKSIDEECASNVECGTAYCDPDQLICARFPLDMQCTYGTQCESRHCNENGICDKAPLGTICEHNQSCASDLCDEFTGKCSETCESPSECSPETSICFEIDSTTGEARCYAPSELPCGGDHELCKEILGDDRAACTDEGKCDLILAEFGEPCSADSDCESGLCDPGTGKCSIWCNGCWDCPPNTGCEKGIRMPDRSNSRDLCRSREDIDCLGNPINCEEMFC